MTARTRSKDPSLAKPAPSPPRAPRPRKKPALAPSAAVKLPAAVVATPAPRPPCAEIAATAAAEPAPPLAPSPEPDYDYEGGGGGDYDYDDDGGEPPRPSAPPAPGSDPTEAGDAIASAPSAVPAAIITLPAALPVLGTTPSIGTAPDSGGGRAASASVPAPAPPSRVELGARPIPATIVMDRPRDATPAGPSDPPPARAPPPLPVAPAALEGARADVLLAAPPVEAPPSDIDARPSLGTPAVALAVAATSAPRGVDGTGLVDAPRPPLAESAGPAAPVAVVLAPTSEAYEAWQDLMWIYGFDEDDVFALRERGGDQMGLQLLENARRRKIDVDEAEVLEKWRRYTLRFYLGRG